MSNWQTRDDMYPMGYGMSAAHIGASTLGVSGPNGELPMSYLDMDGFPHSVPQMAHDFSSDHLNPHLMQQYPHVSV